MAATNERKQSLHKLVSLVVCPRKVPILAEAGRRLDNCVILGVTGSAAGGGSTYRWGHLDTWRLNRAAQELHLPPVLPSVCSQVVYSYYSISHPIGAFTQGPHENTLKKLFEDTALLEVEGGRGGII